MPPDVQDPPNTYNIHRRRHEPMEDQHDTGPQGRRSRDRNNYNQERGVQGDSPSPLLFTMSLNPLSQELQKTGYGYQLDEQTKINHLFYIDDLKLYGTSDNQLTGLINTVKNVSDDIKMEYGLYKCVKASFKRGKNVLAEGILLNDNQVIQDLDTSETYKHLGMVEGEGVQHHKMKVKIRKEYKRRIK